MNLQKYCEKLLGKRVELFFPIFDGVARSVETERYAKIEINGNLDKVERLVALAHELSHLILKSSRHDKEQDELMRKIMKDLAKMYGFKFAELEKIKRKLDKVAGVVIE